MNISSSKQAAGALLIAGLFAVTACGQSATDQGDDEIEAAADVAKSAAPYVGDPWERRAREEYLDRMNAPDGWEHLAIERNERQVARQRDLRDQRTEGAGRCD